MEKINFKDLPSTETPINAGNLNLMQNNIEEEINDITSVGEWKPTITNWQNIPLGVNYTTQFGYYMKFRNLVYIEFQLAFKITQLNPENNYAKITGLPFKIASESGLLATQIYDAVATTKDLKILNSDDNSFGIYSDYGAGVVNWKLSNSSQYQSKVNACGWVRLK